MKKVLSSLIIVVFSVLTLVPVKAQQEPQVSHNMFNQLMVNPGYAGSNGSICASLIGRNQWMGFKGAPKTNIVSIDAPINSISSGVGVSILSDNLGFEKNVGLRLNYAYIFRNLFSGELGVGLQGGFLNKSLDFSQFKTTDPEALAGGSTSDPLLASKATEKTMMFDIGFGVFYKMDKKLYVGLSTNQMLQSEGTFSGSKAKPVLARHYYFSAGYYYPINQDLELQPSVFVKTDAASTQLDINLMALYKSRFWGGLSYRMQDAAVAMVGLYPFGSSNKSLAPLRVGLAYDIVTSAMGASGRSSGSVEVFLGYCFKIEVERIPSSYRNTRYL